MRTIVIIALLIGLAFIPTAASAGEHKLLQLNKDILLGGANPATFSGDVFVNTTDNITINWRNGNLADGSKLVNICIGIYGQPALKWSDTIDEYIPSYNPSANCAGSFWKYFKQVLGPSSSPMSFSVVPSTTGIINIYMETNSALTFNVTIAQGNFFIDRNTTLQVMTELKDQVKDLQTNMTNAQNQIQYLTQQINTMNNTQKQMLVNITNLWNVFVQLNASLNDLTEIINSLNISSLQNYSQDIAWIEQNITRIKQDIHELNINDTSNYYDLIKDLQITNRGLMDLSDAFYNLTSSMPKAYNDTALKNQIAQLQKDNVQLKSENSQLRANIETLNKTKNEKIIEKKPDNTIGMLAVGISIVAMMMALLLFNLCIIQLKSMKAKLSGASKDSSQSGSDEYEDVEEKPKEIPKVKAKTSKTDDDEDLDDVMDKHNE